MIKTLKSVSTFKTISGWNKYNKYYFSKSVQYYKAVLASDIIKLIRSKEDLIHSIPAEDQKPKTLRQDIVDFINEKKF